MLTGPVPPAGSLAPPLRMITRQSRYLTYGGRSTLRVSVCRPLSTYGYGNEPQVVFWGPGYENEDVSVYKSFTLKKESDSLS